MQKSKTNNQDISGKVAPQPPRFAPPKQPASPSKPRLVLKPKALSAAHPKASTAKKNPQPDAPQNLASTPLNSPHATVQKHLFKKSLPAKKLLPVAQSVSVEQAVPAKRLARVLKPKLVPAQSPVVAEVQTPEPSTAVHPSALPPTPLQNTQLIPSPPLDAALQHLPESLQHQIAALVTPCVQQLVAEEPDPLARSFGNSIVICTVLEILSQHGLLREMLSSPADSLAIEKSLARFERILKQKLSAANFLLRYKSFCRLANK
jgi:hypothetical protein